MNVIVCRLPDPARGRTRYGTRVHYLMRGNGEPNPDHPFPPPVYTFCGRRIGRVVFGWGDETTDPVDCTKCQELAPS